MRKDWTRNESGIPGGLERKHVHNQNGHDMEPSRQKGKLKQSWRRTVTKEPDNIGKTRNEAEIASNRARCRAMVEALRLMRGKED